jgi:hypothetical protein
MTGTIFTRCGGCPLIFPIDNRHYRVKAHRVALLGPYFAQESGIRRLDLDVNFIGLNFEERLSLFNHVAFRFEPAQNFDPIALVARS